MLLRQLLLLAAAVVAAAVAATPNDCGEVLEFNLSESAAGRSSGWRWQITSQLGRT